MKSRWLGLGLIAAMWSFAAAVFPRLPEEIPTHWGLSGQVDGWSPRWPGAYIAPLVGTLVWAVLLAMPMIDPRKRNVARTGENRLLMANLVLAFMAILEGLTLGVALGWLRDATPGLMLALGLLLVAMGNYLPRVRSNWWIGIRTPWTMDSEAVWRETHRVGGRVFVIGGMALMLVALLPVRARNPFALVVILATVLLPVAYSFVAWRRQAAGPSSS